MPQEAAPSWVRSRSTSPARIAKRRGPKTFTVTIPFRETPIPGLRTRPLSVPLSPAARPQPGPCCGLQTDLAVHAGRAPGGLRVHARPHRRAGRSRNDAGGARARRGLQEQELPGGPLVTDTAGDAGHPPPDPRLRQSPRAAPALHRGLHRRRPRIESTFHAVQYTGHHPERLWRRTVLGLATHVIAQITRHTLKLVLHRGFGVDVQTGRIPCVLWNSTAAVLRVQSGRFDPP